MGSCSDSAPNQQRLSSDRLQPEAAPVGYRVLAGVILIEMLLQGGEVAMAADLSRLAQAQPCQVGGGEGQSTYSR